MPKKKPHAKIPPRYLIIADKLREKVLRGDYSAPSGFPTESVLCKKFDVSRFTIREALRQLTSEGLIIRKHGSGTIVRPTAARDGTLHQPFNGNGEPRQFAHDTAKSYEKMTPQRIPTKIAKQIGTSDKRKWLVFHGKKQKTGHQNPQAVSTIWINPDLADAVEKIDMNGATFFGQIEKYGEVNISRVTQIIQAISSTKKLIKDLGLDESAPVLRILRYYFDDKDKLLEISASHHPGERFAYSMHIKMDKPSISETSP